MSHYPNHCGIFVFCAAYWYLFIILKDYRWEEKQSQEACHFKQTMNTRIKKNFTDVQKKRFKHKTHQHDKSFSQIFTKRKGENPTSLMKESWNNLSRRAQVINALYALLFIYWSKWQCWGPTVGRDTYISVKTSCHSSKRKKKNKAVKRESAESALCLSGRIMPSLFWHMADSCCSPTSTLYNYYKIPHM